MSRNGLHPTTGAPSARAAAPRSPFPDALPRRLDERARDDCALAAAGRAADTDSDAGKGQVVISARRADGSGDLIVVTPNRALETIASMLADGTDFVSVEPNETVRVLDATGPLATPTTARSDDGRRGWQWALDR